MAIKANNDRFEQVCIPLLSLTYQSPSPSQKALSEVGLSGIL